MESANTMFKTVMFIAMGLTTVLFANDAIAEDRAPSPHKFATLLNDFGSADTLTVVFDRPVAYVPHPNGGVTVRYVDGLRIKQINTATKDRGGAMWNPGAGKLGYADWKPQGFDRHMKDKGDRDTYSAELNVAPAATGSPFTVPGEGSLVVAIPRETNDATKVVGQFLRRLAENSGQGPGRHQSPAQVAARSGLCAVADRRRGRTV